MDSDIITNRINQLEPEYRDFVLSEYIDMTEAIFGQSLGLDETRTSVLGNGLTMYLLLFLNKFELIEFTIQECKVNINNATDTINTILNGLPNEMTASIAEAKAKLEQDEPTPIKEIDRLQILSSLGKNKLYAYLFAKTSHTLNLIISNYRISEDQIIMLRELTGDIILGFYKISDTVPLIQQELELDPKTSALLGAEILEFITPLLDPTWQVADGDDSQASTNNYEAEADTITSENDAVMQTLNILDSPANSSSPNFTIPANLKPQTIPELRTMADDMRSPLRADFEPIGSDNTPTYTSNQDLSKSPAVPSYTAPLYNSPKAAPLEPPRWG